jgi:hypothetical protein
MTICGTHSTPSRKSLFLMLLFCSVDPQYPTTPLSASTFYALVREAKSLLTRHLMMTHLFDKSGVMGKARGQDRNCAIDLNPIEP